MSHACGAGCKDQKEIVKLMLFLIIQSLSYSHSSVQLKTVERLIDFYNNNIIPILFTRCSLGTFENLVPEHIYHCLLFVMVRFVIKTKKYQVLNY